MIGKEYFKEYCFINREKRKLRSKEWDLNHKSEIKARKKLYYLDNKEHIIKRGYVNTLKRIYGMTIKDYNKLFTLQKGCCAICGKHQTECNKTLCVDHNHETGEVRGLLCHSCNVALGLLKEDINSINNIINYLKIYSDVR